MSDIFISYAKADKQRAKIVARALEKEGFDVWWDIEIPTGKNFHHVIDKAINESKCVIVLWTKSSIHSEWVHIEAAEGKNRNILVPILLDDVELPLEFRRRQTADFINWNQKNSDPVFKKVLEDIRLLIPKSNISNLGNGESKLSDLSTKFNYPIIYIPLLFLIIFGFLISLANHLNIFYKTYVGYIIPYNTIATIAITLILVLAMIFMINSLDKNPLMTKKLMLILSIPFIFLLFYIGFANIIAFLNKSGFVHSGKMGSYQIKFSSLVSTILTLSYYLLIHKKKRIRLHWLILGLSIPIMFFTIPQFIYLSFSYLVYWDYHILTLSSDYFINFSSILITVLYILFLIVFKPRYLSFGSFS